MGERNIAAEVLRGLREIREHRAGERTLHTIQVQAKPLADLTPGMTARIRESLDESTYEEFVDSPPPNSERAGSGQNGMFDIEGFTKRLRDLDALRGDDQIQSGIVESIRPQYAEEWPPELEAHVQDALVAAGAPRPYRHQAEAVTRSLCGYDVVLESPTAEWQDHGLRCADAA